MKREELKSMFDALRNDPQHHLGLGDIRLTVAQQDLILDAIDVSLPPAEGAEQKCQICNKPALSRGLCYEHEICNIPKPPQPPAEGAEQRIRVRNILQDFYHRGEYELEQAEEDIMRLFQPQPTAEGAEEILRKNCNTCYSRSTGEEEVWSSVSSVLIAMQDFATLHAQRIAEKMVEERMEQYKAQFKDRPNPLEVNPYDSKGIKRKGTKVIQFTGMKKVGK